MRQADIEPCPAGWEYESVDHHDRLLRERTLRVLGLLSEQSPNAYLLAKDTRSIHRSLFRDLTPAGFDYFAGSYRGCEHRCLKDYRVHVRSDPRVGHDPSYVHGEMDFLATEIDQIIRNLDIGWRAAEAVFSREQKLFRTIEVAAAVFVFFLEIHPYANGNGHAARLILTMIGLRYGVRFRRFPVHPRPPQPTYAEAITLHRSGNPRPLERLLLSCL